jgi:hypothetical protein
LTTKLKLERMCREKLGDKFRDINIRPTTDMGMEITLLTSNRGFSHWKIEDSTLETFHDKPIEDLWNYLSEGVERLINNALKK